MTDQPQPMDEDLIRELEYQRQVAEGETPIQLLPPRSSTSSTTTAAAAAKKKTGGRTQGGPASRTGQNIRTGLVPARSRAYQYVYRAHHGASKGLTAKQIRHLYRYRPKKRVSAATRERIRKMGAINGPALKKAKAIAKAEGRKMTKQDFYNAGGTPPKVPAGGV